MSMVGNSGERMLHRLAPVGIFSSLVFASLFLYFPAQATSIEWEGKYRFELIDIENPSLLSDNPHNNKAYWLNYAELRPDIIASDSLRIKGRFLLLPNATGVYANSHLGSFMGTGPGGAGSTDDGNSNTLSRQQSLTGLAVSEMYMTWEQEYGALLVGRAPLEFGLGMQYDSGRDLFDHWADTRDLVAYKVVSGNITMIPMLATINEGALGTNADDVKEQIFQFGYVNPDSNLKLGFLYVNRYASVSGGNDTPANLGGTVSDHYKVQDMNLYAGQDGENFSYGFEFGFKNGQTGLRNASGDDIKWEGLGVAANFSFIPSGDWSYHFHFAYATGDDTNSDDKYEGYIFHRNYDAGFLLFNHPLGDPSLQGGAHRLTQGGTTIVEDMADEDSITNATVMFPEVRWRADEDLELRIGLISASLNSSQIADQATDLGTEFDISLLYKPYEKMEWITTFGYLSPGGAFEGGASAFDTKPSYGITTKAAISF